MAEITLTPPRSFVIGSTVQWRVRSTDYPPDGSRTAEIAFVTSSDSRQVAASDYGDGTWLVSITPAESGAFEPELYRYQFNVTEGSDRFSIASGIIEACANYAAISGGLDDRSSNAKIYDAITAVMEGKATQDQSSLAIGGRSLSRYSWEELISARGHHAHLMNDAERMARGLMPRGHRTVRFTR